MLNNTDNEISVPKSTRMTEKYPHMLSCTLPGLPLAPLTAGERDIWNFTNDYHNTATNVISILPADYEKLSKFSASLHAAFFVFGTASSVGVSNGSFQPTRHNFIQVYRTWRIQTCIYAGMGMSILAFMLLTSLTWVPVDQWSV